MNLQGQRVDAYPYLVALFKALRTAKAADNYAALPATLFAPRAGGPGSGFRGGVTTGF
ncbi:hypothetical protein ACUXQ2_005703 [Cupriavidus metallidurans]